MCACVSRDMKITESTDHGTMNSSKRTKSDPGLSDSNKRCSLLVESPDSDSQCQTVCNGTDARSAPVNATKCSTSSDKADDNSQYVALDCEFVGVGPKRLSALGMCASDYASRFTAQYHGSAMQKGSVKSNSVPMMPLDCRVEDKKA